MFLYVLCDALDKGGVRYAICGGFAVALHGAVRGTVDIDLVLLLTEANLTKAEKQLQSIGLKSRIPVSAKEIFQFRKEYIQNRNLLAWSFSNPSNPIEVVDLLIVRDLRGMKVDRMQVGLRKLKVLSKKDLIKMKRAAGRAQDLEDVKALEALEK